MLVVQQPNNQYNTAPLKPMCLYVIVLPQQLKEMAFGKCLPGLL